MASSFPHLGFGLGLRAQHYPYIFENRPSIDWFEIISENFMDTDGRPKRNLARVAEHYPIVMHGVALSIGTVDPLNSEYLQKLKKLIDWVKPPWISDHLCWTGIAHKNTHDLLPIPYTEEALKHVVNRVTQVQDFLGRPIALENPSTYLEFKSSQIPEAEFIACMVKNSGCNLLLDVNNVYVTCFNNHLDPKTYIDALPLDSVAQIHLSGHTNEGTHIIDTHDDHVVDEVWALYQYVLKKAGRIPNTMVEWDDKIPEFTVLQAELAKARAVAIEVRDRPLPDLLKPQAPYVMNHSITMADEQKCLQTAILLGHSADSPPEEWIRTKENFGAKDQLGVYINAYRSRLFEVTADEYPVLQHYLGKDVFDDLLTSFIRTLHSEHFNIGRFPARLPEFLAQYGLADPFALELCTLENAVSQLFDYPETAPLAPDHLVGLTPETLLGMVLQPRDALQLFAFDYRVNQYFIDVKQTGGAPEPKHSPSFLVVFRHHDTVWRMDLDADEYSMLQMLFSGMTVGAALKRLENDDSESDTELTAKLSQWFARWMRNGLLAQSKDRHTQTERSAA